MSTSYTPARHAAPATSTTTNTLSIVALVLAFVTSLGGIICGHIALAQIKKTGERGRGLAIAALVVGYVFLALGILFTILYIIGMVALASSVTLNG